MMPDTARRLIADLDAVEMDMRRLESRLTSSRERLASVCGVNADPRVNAQREQARADGEAMAYRAQISRRRG